MFNPAPGITLNCGTGWPTVLFSGNIEYNGRSLVHSIVNDISEAKLLEEQLRQAQKMEAIGSLAGGVAHDFNNMLGVIIGHTGIVLDTPGLADSVKVSLQEVQDAAQRSADITRQLLTFARQQTIQPEHVDLNSAVEGMIKVCGWTKEGIKIPKAFVAVDENTMKLRSIKFSLTWL